MDVDRRPPVLYREDVVYHGRSNDEKAPAHRSGAADEGPELGTDAGSASEPSVGGESRRRRLERSLPEVLKRAIEKGLEAGLGTLSSSGEVIRGVVGKVELPKELANYVFSQIDDTKNAVVRVVAREVREFLEAADLATELRRVLTTLAFEIRTEIRFIPNEAGGIRPEVKANIGAAPTGTRRSRRGLRRLSQDPTEGDARGPHFGGAKDAEALPDDDRD